MQMEVETKKRFKEMIESIKKIEDKIEKCEKMAELKSKIELYDIAVQLCYGEDIKDKLFKAKDTETMERIMHDARLALN